MKAAITLGGFGTSKGNKKAAERVDVFCEILNNAYEGAIEFSMRSRYKIDCEFIGMANAKTLLECVLDGWARPDEVESFMESTELRFEKIEFDTGWAE